MGITDGTIRQLHLRMLRHMQAKTAAISLSACYCGRAQTVPPAPACPQTPACEPPAAPLHVPLAQLPAAAGATGPADRPRREAGEALQPMQRALLRSLRRSGSVLHRCRAQQHRREAEAEKRALQRHDPLRRQSHWQRCGGRTHGSRWRRCARHHNHDCDHDCDARARGRGHDDQTRPADPTRGAQSRQTQQMHASCLALTVQLQVQLQLLEHRDSRNQAARSESWQQHSLRAGSRRQARLHRPQTHQALIHRRRQARRRRLDWRCEAGCRVRRPPQLAHPATDQNGGRRRCEAPAAAMRLASHPHNSNRRLSSLNSRLRMLRLTLKRGSEAAVRQQLGRLA